MNIYLLIGSKLTSFSSKTKIYPFLFLEYTYFKRRIEYYPKSISRFETNCQKRNTIQIFLLSTLNNISRIFRFTGICTILQGNEQLFESFSSLHDISKISQISYRKINLPNFPTKNISQILFHLTKIIKKNPFIFR